MDRRQAKSLRSNDSAGGAVMRRKRWHRSRVLPPPRLVGDGLERADSLLLRIFERDFEGAVRASGPWLACRPGCSECCVGPFPITRLDVWRLSRGLERLKETAPPRAEAVLVRARGATAALRDRYPGDASTGRLDGDLEALDRFFERHRSLPCPALDPDSRRCDLYEWRPASCRTYGPPARFGNEASPPCRLCFEGAPAEEIERCRMKPDRDGFEESILAALGVRGGEEWETLIAFALVRSELLVRGQSFSY